MFRANPEKMGSYRKCEYTHGEGLADMFSNVGNHHPGRYKIWSVVLLETNGTWRSTSKFIWKLGEPPG